MPQRKDFYDVLGVSKDASSDSISAAYKKLAMEHHPDKNLDDPNAKERFQDLLEAKEILLDPRKRER
jgi:DnaJ-class molecular chaperone